jgi:molecular chaperone HtpG
LIQKSSKDIMPEYLRFVKGVVDSEEIPLNISRETIQNNVKIDKIRKHILKKLLGLLEKIKDKDREKYLRIWDNFSRNLKEGIASDFENKDKISPLLLFHSSKKTKEEYTDLKEYTERMGKDQKEIYYITGLDLEALAKNPALEAFLQKDLEVLYLTDPLDEFVVEHLREFAGKPFCMAESADIKLDTDKKKTAAALKDGEGFIAYLKKLYGGRITDVRVSNRLVESPCLLVHPSEGPSVHMEKILKMANKDYQFTKKVLEINPDNELIKEMVRVHKTAPQSKELEALALQMLDNMLLREGVLEDIDQIVPRIQQIMLQAAKKVKPQPKPKPKTAKKEKH